MKHDEQYTLDRRAALSQLLLVTDLMKSDMTIGLAKRGLTQVRAHVIWEVGQHQPMTQKQLSVILGVTPRNVTTLLDSLETLGFIERKAHPTDRRATLVSLSAKGRTTLGQLQTDMSKLADLLFSTVTADDLAAFMRVLTGASHALAGLSSNTAEGGLRERSANC